MMSIKDYSDDKLQDQMKKAKQRLRDLQCLDARTQGLLDASREASMKAEVWYEALAAEYLRRTNEQLDRLLEDL